MVFAADVGRRSPFGLGIFGIGIRTATDTDGRSCDVGAPARSPPSLPQLVAITTATAAASVVNVRLVIDFSPGERPASNAMPFSPNAPASDKGLYAVNAGVR